jgi:signal transduction histidine kinase
MHVGLDRSGKAVRLIVREEGRGFRPDEARSNGPGGGFALQSEPGFGTKVTAEVDLLREREDADYAG